MDQETKPRQKKKDGLKMDNGLEIQLRRINNTLSAKLAVRSCQYRIALEGLRAIEEFGDTSVASKTLEAMLDCVPDNPT